MEKLESLGQEKDFSSDEDAEIEQDYPSFDSDLTSPRNSEPTSLTESMQLVDNILKNDKIDRFDKIDKLEAILSAAAFIQNDNDNNSYDSIAYKCNCNCHMKNNLNRALNDGKIITATGNFISKVTTMNNNDNYNSSVAKENHIDVETQTLSTGDIVVTKIFFNEATD